MAAFIQRTEDVYASHHYLAKLWRETRAEAAPAGHLQGQQGPGVRGESCQSSIKKLLDNNAK
jgi:hypothetical protein